MLGAVVLVVAAAVAGETTINVVYDDGRADEEIAVFTLSSDPGIRFLRANHVARLFRANQFWNASTRKVVLGVGEARFILTVDTRVIVIDGEPIMLRSPVRYDGGFVLVPMEFILEIASHYTPRTFLWSESSRTLHVQGISNNIEGISFGTAADRTTVTIDLTEPLLYHMDANTPGLVRLKFYGGRIDPRAFSVRERHGIVEGVRAEQSERDAYLYFDIDPATRRLRIDRDENHVTLVLEKGELPEIPEPSYQGRADMQIVDTSAPERRTVEIRRVCLDAGHGGQDHGKTGQNGLLEKDVNLQLVRAIRMRLEDELGVEVVLTRDDDRLLSLTRRTEIANEHDADLFISVHCNAWFSKRTGGFEAYFLSPARSESARALARFENAAGKSNDGGPAGDVEFILWDLVQNDYINESSALAEFIQKAMDERLDVRNRGVKQANFTVLQGARMPAVLIEAAFLSNPLESQLLADEDFHLAVADGVVDAVRQMQKRYR